MGNITNRVNNLINSLQKSFIQSQKNQIDTIKKNEDVFAEHANNISNISETLDVTLTEELPAQTEQIQTVSDAVDYILTDVIPGILEG